MMRFFLLLFVTAFTLSLPAQTNRKIKELQNKRSLLQKQINQKENLLNTTKKDVRTQLRNLNTLSGQIEERKHYIEGIGNDVKTIDGEVSVLNSNLTELEQQLQERKQKYAKSLQTLYRAKSFHEKLMFVFSASSLQQAYRRMRYLQDYAGYQRILAISIQQQQEKIRLKREELEGVRVAKASLLREGEVQKQKLEGQERLKRNLVAKLEKQQKGLQQEIARHRKEANQLNAQIDRMVAIEIEKARKRAEEEARRRAAAERAAAERRKAELAKSSKSGAGKTEAREEATEEKKTAPPMENYRESTEDIRLSKNFANNRGRLPMPISGSYIIVNHYGQYSVEGLRGVRLDSKGINIQGQSGAQARAIFDGEVASIFKVNGLSNVIVRHGTYLSVYCNLSSVSVSAGQKVSTRQSLGRIFSDPNDGGRTILHFQLRKETAKLNPEQWLAR